MIYLLFASFSPRKTSYVVSHLFPFLAALKIMEAYGKQINSEGRKLAGSRAMASFQYPDTQEKIFLKYWLEELRHQSLFVSKYLLPLRKCKYM